MGYVRIEQTVMDARAALDSARNDVLFKGRLARISHHEPTAAV